MSLRLMEMIDEKNNWQHRHSQLTKAMKRLEEEKVQEEQTKQAVKDEIAAIEKRIEDLKVEKEVERQNFEKIKSERNYLSKTP